MHEEKVPETSILLLSILTWRKLRPPKIIQLSQTTTRLLDYIEDHWGTRVMTTI